MRFGFQRQFYFATKMSTESELQLKNRVYNKVDKRHTTMAAVATPSAVAPMSAVARAKDDLQKKRKQKPAGKNANKKVKAKAQRVGGKQTTVTLLEKFDREGLCKIIAMIRNGQVNVSGDAEATPEQRTQRMLIKLETLRNTERDHLHLRVWDQETVLKIIIGFTRIVVIARIVVV